MATLANPLLPPPRRPPLIDPSVLANPYQAPAPQAPGDLVPFDPTRNPEDMLANERARATGLSDIITGTQLQGEYPYHRDLERRYQTLGDLAHLPLLTGGAGLTPEDVCSRSAMGRRPCPEAASSPCAYRCKAARA